MIRHRRTAPLGGGEGGGIEGGFAVLTGLNLAVDAVLCHHLAVAQSVIGAGCLPAEDQEGAGVAISRMR